MGSILRAGAIAWALAAGAASLHAEPIRAGALVIDAPWARATPKGAPVAGAYLTITNTGSDPDTLLSVSIAGAGRTEIHDMSLTNGVMQMRPHAGGLVVAPGATVTLTPSGTHLMLMDLAGGLTKGQQVDGTLTFAKAGTVAVRFTVEGLGATRPSP